MSVPTPQVRTFRRAVTQPPGGGVVTLLLSPALASLFPVAGRLVRFTVKRTAGDAPSFTLTVRSTSSAVAADQAGSFVLDHLAPVVPAAADAPDLDEDNGGPGWPFNVLPNPATGDQSLAFVITAAGGGVANTTYQVTATIETWAGSWVEVP